jgi:hypothetical protein
MARRAREIAEDALHLCRHPALALGEPALEQGQIGLIARFKIGRHQVVLALEVIIEGALGDACLRSDRVDADAPDALAIEQLRGG